MFPSRANPMSADRQMVLTSTSQCERTELIENSQSPKNHKSEKKVYATIKKGDNVCVSHVHRDIILNNSSHHKQVNLPFFDTSTVMVIATYRLRRDTNIFDTAPRVSRYHRTIITAVQFRRNKEIFTVSGNFGGVLSFSITKTD